MVVLGRLIKAIRTEVVRIGCYIGEIVHVGFDGCDARTLTQLHRLPEM